MLFMSLEIGTFMQTVYHRFCHIDPNFLLGNVWDEWILRNLRLPLGIG